MNIFALDNNPKEAAQALCNKHVVKMILESAQLLSTVAQLRGFDSPYKLTHKNHPCTKWLGEHPANWWWLCRHAAFMCLEYSERYGKIHKCQSIIEDLENRSPKIWEGTNFEDHSDYGEESHTPFVQCMPEEYKQENPIEAYRAYYCGAKRDFAKWTSPAEMPKWFK